MQTHYGIQFKDNDPLVSARKALVARLFRSPVIDAAAAHKAISAMQTAGEVELRFLENDLTALEADFTLPTHPQALKEFYDFITRKVKEWAALIGELHESEVAELAAIYPMDNSVAGVFNLSGSFTSGSVRSPKDIKQRLDRTVIGQEQAKVTLSFVFYLHMLRTGRLKPSILDGEENSEHINYSVLPKPNVLLCGSTGSGKTFIIKTLCEMFDIPFAKVDCASLVSSGYVGNNLNDGFLHLIERAGDAQKAASGIIYFDEFDKISENSIGRSGSVGGIELQQEFLNALEDKERIVKQKDSRGNYENITLKTDNILFVFSGSFAGVEKLIEKRNPVGRKLGFGATNTSRENTNKSSLSMLRAEDVIEFGVLPELVGRINYFVPLDPLGVDEIISIMKTSEKSPLKLYENFFRLHLDKLTIEEDVFPLIAERVLAIGGGGRAITSVLQQLLNQYLYECPNEQMEHYIVDRNYFYQVFPKN